MGLILDFSGYPTRGCLVRALWALMQMVVSMLDHDLLGATGANAAKRFELGREGPRQLVRHALVKRCLLKGRCSVQPAGSVHCRRVNGGHLSGKRNLGQVGRLKVLDECEMSIEHGWIERTISRRELAELGNDAIGYARVVSP